MSLLFVGMLVALRFGGIIFYNSHFGGILQIFSVNILIGR